MKVRIEHLAGAVGAVEIADFYGDGRELIVRAETGKYRGQLLRLFWDEVEELPANR